MLCGSQPFPRQHQQDVVQAAQLKAARVLQHTCTCHAHECVFPACNKLREMFKHSIQCGSKVTGGCKTCTTLWRLLLVHVKFCTNTFCCPVPRCNELKMHRNQQQQQ